MFLNIFITLPIFEREKKYFNTMILCCGGVKNPLLDWSLLHQLWGHLVSKGEKKSKNMQRVKCIKTRHPPKERTSVGLCCSGEN